MKLINSGLNFGKIVMMVQEEVGERFSATPGKKLILLLLSFKLLL